MKFLIILSLAVAASGFPESQLVLRNRVVPVQDGIEGRITGGEKAAAGQIPYQTGLSLSDGNGVYWCGGSLINPIWILTAAHCVEGMTSITAFMGATDRKVPEATRAVSAAFMHPDWNADTVQNDIAMLKLISAVTLSNKIKLVSLPTAPQPDYVGQNAIISGWGYDSDKANDVTRDLLFAIVEVVNGSVCQAFYGGVYFTKSNICILTPQNKSTCSGDSGGPMVLISNNQQIGITSYGSAAGCEKGHPAVFTRVENFVPWIQKIINS